MKRIEHEWIDAVRDTPGRARPIMFLTMAENRPGSPIASKQESQPAPMIAASTSLGRSRVVAPWQCDERDKRQHRAATAPSADLPKSVMKSKKSTTRRRQVRAKREALGIDQHHETSNGRKHDEPRRSAPSAARRSRRDVGRQAMRARQALQRGDRRWRASAARSRERTLSPLARSWRPLPNRTPRSSKRLPLLTLNRSMRLPRVSGRRARWRAARRCAR